MRSKEPKVSPSSDYYLYQPSTLASKIYLYPTIVGQFFYEPGYSLKRSSYNSYLLMYLAKGSCRGRSEGKEFYGARNQFILLDCYKGHEYDFPSGAEVLWLHFDGPLAKSYYELITSIHGNVLTIPSVHSICHDMTKIIERFRNSAPIREAAISNRITQILTNLLDTRSDDSLHSSQSQVAENSIAYINEHFSEPVTLDALAANANLSPYYFTRLFNAETGFTPHQYLIITRINSAKFLLKSSSIPIKEIAFASGFNSESSFCSTFKKLENMTPSEYRSNQLSD